MIDTNVLVAALLNPGRTPDRALAAMRSHGAVTLVDDRVEDEYRSVLARPKFRAIDPARRDALLTELLASSERVAVASACDVALVDDDDRVFIEVALAGRAVAVVTGNARHYPTSLGFEVWSPAELLARLGH